MADARSRAELIERLRGLDRADLDAVLRAARAPSDQVAPRAAPSVELTNAGRTALVVEAGGQAEIGLAPARSVDVAIDQPARESATSASADRQGFAGAVRALV